MAMTRDYFYTKFLGQIDKEGSDFYSLPIVMEVLETATSDFIDEVVKFLSGTQQLKDSLLDLYTHFDIPLATNPANPKELIASLPVNYRNLITVQVYDTGSTVRYTDIGKLGEMYIDEVNPQKRATAEYPKVFQYSNTFAVYGPSSGKLRGFYIAKPTFATAGNEVVVDLPDASVEKIMQKMINIINAKEGDPRYQLSNNQEQSFGHANK